MSDPCPHFPLLPLLLLCSSFKGADSGGCSLLGWSTGKKEETRVMLSLPLSLCLAGSRATAASSPWIQFLPSTLAS